ncbi:hypothetical protein [Deinococcus navajonensis]|uniref:Spheroidene monooxygenase n=1 Tax=Deinococcus navajonensis TaxID=309884 RepID=A0ABV8XSN6_9DEIO
MVEPAQPVHPAPPGRPIVSLTLNTYTRQAAWQGLTRMGTDHLYLRRRPGLRFYRLLGTGRGSELTLGADLRRWARLAVWSSPEALEDFEAGAWRARERARTLSSCTYVLRPVRWRGQWGGVDPFGESGPPEPDGPAAAQPAGPVAVLTRASIRPSRLLSFWRAVPAAQLPLRDQPGLLFAVGVGEVPLLHQATFSVWRSAEDMKAFAYGSAAHRQVIARTQQEHWYREELFARFTVLEFRGNSSDCGSQDAADERLI